MVVPQSARHDLERVFLNPIRAVYALDWAGEGHLQQSNGEFSESG